MSKSRQRRNRMKAIGIELPVTPPVVTKKEVVVEAVKAAVDAIIPTRDEGTKAVEELLDSTVQTDAKVNEERNWMAGVRETFFPSDPADQIMPPWQVAMFVAGCVFAISVVVHYWG
jgi:NADPH-dependent glutamate synthase beta subunit-like oxidoreductase